MIMVSTDVAMTGHAGKTELALAAISASELLHGIHRLRASARKIRAEAWVEAILGALPIVPFDLACARAHARLGAHLARKGVTIGAHDLVIGKSRDNNVIHMTQ